MMVFEFLPIEGGTFYTCDSKKDLRDIMDGLFSGNFKELPNKHIRLTQGTHRNKSIENFDFPSFHPDGLLATLAGMKTISPFIEQCGCWTEFYSIQGPLYLDVNETKFIECDGYKLGVTQYAFKPCTKYWPIFRLSNLKGHFPLVTESFIEFYNQNKLTGLRFKLVGEVES